MSKPLWLAVMAACVIGAFLLTLRLAGLLLTPWWVIVALAAPALILCALIVLAVLAWAARGAH